MSTEIKIEMQEQREKRFVGTEQGWDELEGHMITVKAPDQKHEASFFVVFEEPDVGGGLGIYVFLPESGILVMECEILGNYTHEEGLDEIANFIYFAVYTFLSEECMGRLINVHRYDMKQRQRIEDEIGLRPDSA